MNAIKKQFNKAVNFINKIAITLSEVALVALLCLIVYSSIARYFFRSPSIYGTEISLYLVLASTWFAAGYVHQVGRHVSVEVFSNNFGKWLSLFSKVISNLSIILFCLVLVWAGYMVAETAFIRGYKSTTMLRFPLWITYGLIPIGGFILGLTAIKRFINSHDENQEDSKESI